MALARLNSDRHRHCVFGAPFFLTCVRGVLMLRGSLAALSRRTVVLADVTLDLIAGVLLGVLGQMGG